MIHIVIPLMNRDPETITRLGPRQESFLPCCWPQQGRKDSCPGQASPWAQLGRLRSVKPSQNPNYCSQIFFQFWTDFHIIYVLRSIQTPHYPSNSSTLLRLKLSTFYFSTSAFQHSQHFHPMFILAKPTLSGVACYLQ